MKRMEIYLDGCEAEQKVEEFIEEIAAKLLHGNIEWFNHERSDGKTICIWDSRENLIGLATVLRTSSNKSLLVLDDLREIPKRFV